MRVNRNLTITIDLLVIRTPYCKDKLQIKSLVIGTMFASYKILIFEIFLKNKIWTNNSLIVISIYFTSTSFTTQDTLCHLPNIHKYLMDSNEE